MVPRPNIDEPVSKLTFAVESVGVQFGALQALNDVSLSFPQDEIVGLIGPNGAGKTTLINVVTGFQKPTTGRVLMAGRDISGLSPQRRARLGLSRTYQHGRLFRHLTTFENVEVGAVGTGMNRRRARMATEEALERCDLIELRAEIAADLPNGIESLVGLARAIVAKPDFVLLDEPTAGLNDEETEQVGELVRGLHGSMGCGVLIVEHKIRFIMGLTDRIYVLNQGAVLAAGTPAEIRNDESVLQAYLGTSVETG